MKYLRNVDFLIWLAIAPAILLLIAIAPANVARPPAKIVYPTENEWTEANAKRYNGKTGVVLWDLTRPDIVTETHAIEVDWAKKWKEAPTQAAYYGIQTGLKPGIILLVKNRETDMKYVYRCQLVASKYGIRVWVETVKPKADAQR